MADFRKEIGHLRSECRGEKIRPLYFLNNYGQITVRVRPAPSIASTQSLKTSQAGF